MTAVVTVYSRPGCHLCAEALQQLRDLQRELRFELHELDISADEQLERAYFERIPVIAVDGRDVSELILDENVLRERLESSQ